MPERLTVEARQDRGTAPTRPSVVDLAPDAAGWDAFVARSNPGSYLQTTAWAEVKAPNGWRPVRFVGTRPVARGGVGLEGPQPDETRTADEDQPGEAGEETAFGAQFLLRKPRAFPWAFAYAPRGPVFEEWNPATLEAFTGALRPALVSAG
ncbi:MAG TPA: hypothetical protein VF349_04255, partial [Candidatus Limnocylindrales bacterium]